LTYLDYVERAIVQNPWVSEEKAIGYPLTPDLEIRYFLGMWPWVIVGTKRYSS
jgi:hypothetical protein